METVTNIAQMKDFVEDDLKNYLQENKTAEDIFLTTKTGFRP
jgi:hypothetical protein